MIAEAIQIKSEPLSLALDASVQPKSPGRTVASYERELDEHRLTEARLREGRARDADLLRDRDALLQHQATVGDESVHRLLNGLQMIASLLSMQSRASESATVSTQLAVAASRVAMISRIHRRLHDFDKVATIAFRPFLQDLCCDYCTMLSSEERPEEIIVEGIDIELPTATAIPLALIANELITNAAKYGKRQITVSLEERSGQHALCVRNDGLALPEHFDPSESSGLGMKIVRTFVAQIGGRLEHCRGDDGQGARFTVLFH